MEHVVFYQSTQGTPAFRRVASLEDAVSFAEHLRNIEGVTEFSVFSMSPVTLSTRTYYHVEVSSPDAPGAPPAAAPAAGVPEQAPEPAPAPPPMPTTYAAPEPPAAAEPEPAFGAATPDAPPPMTPPMEAAAAPPMSFNALEQEASSPHDEVPPPMASVPFAAAPLPPPTGVAPVETFVKDDPAETSVPADANAETTGPPAIDPNVVDPTTEEVVPSVPTGRRSMGFFARS